MIAQQARRIWQQVNWAFVKDVLLETFSDAWWATLCISAIWSVVYLGYHLDPTLFESMHMQKEFMDAWGHNTRVFDHVAMAALPAVIGFMQGFQPRGKADV